MINYKYKTVINRMDNNSLGALGIRINDTVVKYDLELVNNDPLYKVFLVHNDSYQQALLPGDDKFLSEEVKIKYAYRKESFFALYNFVDGLRSSDVPETSLLASQVFRIISLYGKKFTSSRLSSQAICYANLISLISDANVTPKLVTLSADKLANNFIEAHREYEKSYLEIGDVISLKTAPSHLRRQFMISIKNFVEHILKQADALNDAKLTEFSINLIKRIQELDTTSTIAKGEDKKTPTTENDSITNTSSEVKAS